MFSPKANQILHTQEEDLNFDHSRSHTPVETNKDSVRVDADHLTLPPIKLNNKQITFNVDSIENIDRD